MNQRKDSLIQPPSIALKKIQNEGKNLQQQVKSPKTKLPISPMQVKILMKPSFSIENRKGSEIYTSTQETFNINSGFKTQPQSPKCILGFAEKRDSIFESRKDSLKSPKGLTGLLSDIQIKTKKKNLSLNIVSKFNLDNKIPHLTPITMTRQNSPHQSKSGVKEETTQKYSEGKELPDFKQYNGPFNILHIPEGGLQIEQDESEIDIIEKIANIDGQDDDPLVTKMQCFSEIKQHLVQNQLDYYNQYKKLNNIMEAEKFFEGNSISNYSQMLQKTQTNKLFPKKFGLLKPYINNQLNSNISTRRGSEVGIKIQTQITLPSPRSTTLSIKSPLQSPTLSKMPSIQYIQKNASGINLIQQSAPNNNNQQLSLFSNQLNKQNSLSQNRGIFNKNSNIIIHNQVQPDYPYSINSPPTSEKKIKASKFRQDNVTSPRKNIDQNNFSGNFITQNKRDNRNKDDNNLQNNYKLNYLEDNKNENQEEESEEQIESPLLKQMKAKLPFFMKIKNQNVKGKKGDGLIAEINRLIKQKVYISNNGSERQISLNNQTSLQSLGSNNEIKLQSPIFDKIGGLRAELKRKLKTENKEVDEESLNLNYFSINDKQANVISAGINEMKRFKVLKLGNNRIQNNGLTNIMINMPVNIKSIDISYNSFTHVGLVPFITRISNNSFTQLQDLNIEGNNLGDKSISSLLVAFKDYKKLEKLNLSKNSLTVLSIAPLINFILSNISIKELYLRWNKYNAEAGTKIAEALKNNDTIKVLDLSFNSLGVANNEKQHCPKAFAKLFEDSHQNEIVHLDLSFNQFNLEASTIISQALKKNFSIYGFHFNGNQGQIDQYGFLIPCKEAYNLVSPLETRIQGVKRVDTSNKKIGVSQENCWICQGWEERKFIWRPFISGDVSDEPIFIHINTENYQPKKMEKEVSGNLVQFVHRGMYPPNTKIYYFFVAHGHILFAKEQTNEEINLTNIEIRYSDQNVIIPQINILNTFTTNKNNQILDSESYECKIIEKPRKQILMYPKPQEKELKFIWNLSKSVFNEYQNELDEQLIDQCFEFDVKNSQVELYITNDFLSFKKTLRKYYKQIKDVFKFYSSFKPFLGERWTIPIEIFVEMLDSGPVEIVDEKDLKRCSIAVIFDQCNQNEKKNNNTPLKQLARVAEIKYMQNGLLVDHKKALETLFEKGFQQVCDQVQCEHLWRTTNLWNQDVDLVLQYYKPLINYLFNKYSQKSIDAQLQSVIQQAIIQQSNNQNEESNSAQNILKFTSLSNFKTFVYENVKELSIISIEDIQKCFNLSIQTQVDQINKNRHLYINLLEFYESIARLANLLIVYPVGYDYLEETTLNYFKDIDLCCKLESMLVKIFHKRKDETKLLSEITVSKTSLFDQKIREFMISRQLISNQLVRQDSVQIKSSQKRLNQFKLSKKTSITLPTPIEFAESTYQNSNPELLGVNSIESELFNSQRNALIDGKVVRRSNSVIQTFKSFYFRPPSQEDDQLNSIQEQISNSKQFNLSIRASNQI